MSVYNDSRTSNALETSCSRLIMNDELERSIRQNQIEFRRRLTSLLTQSPIVNEAEIKEHFNICLKLYMENKISIKNAWNLKIIDYMKTVLMSKHQANETLQVAGSSLEASAKIYGIRVDDVHLNTLKLASNMARSNAQQKESTAEEDDQESVQSAKQHARKKKRHYSEKITVAKDPNSLIGDVPKVQSIFFQGSSDIDLVATNLLSSTLTMHYTGYKFMLLSKKNAWLDFKQKPNVNIKKNFLFTISPVNKIQLCAPFQDFEIDEWGVEDESLLNLGVTEESVVYNEDGVPIPQLDGSMPNIFESYTEEVNNNIPENKINCEIDTVKQNIYANDYFYSSSKLDFGNKQITRLWAGPSHWKLKYICRNRTRFTGRNKNNKRMVVKKRCPKQINFFEEIKSINKTKHCKRKLISTDEDYVKCTLPENFLLDNVTNRYLNLKPLYICKTNTDILKEASRNADICNAETANASYESFQDDGFDNVSVHEEIVHFHERQPYKESLVDVPEMAQQTFIPYASKAKQVDMKKLKRSVWEILTNKDDTNKIAEDINQQTVKKIKFSEVYEELPKRLKKKQKEELSCPLAFVSLLHLANENNLNFTKINNHNFYIEKKDYFD